MTIEEFKKYAVLDKDYPEELVGFDKHVKSIEVKKEFGVTNIMKKAFRGCAAEEISIDDGIEMYIYLNENTDKHTVREEIFCGCKKLKKIRLPHIHISQDSDKKYRIVNSCFEGCTALEEVEIPPCVAGIGPSAFEGCVSLKKVDIPLTVTRIYPRAFKGCKSLKALRIPSDCDVAKDAIPSGCTVERYDTDQNARAELIKRANIDKLTDGAYDIKVEERDGAKVIVGYGSKLPANFSVPDGINEIDDKAFTGAEILEKVYIPASVWRIGKDAFRRCINLREVVLSEGIREIDDHAFMVCGKLEDINYPHSLEVIGAAVFNYCEKLKNPQLNEGLKKLGRYAFGESGITALAIPAGCEFDNPAAIADITIGGEDWDTYMHKQFEKESQERHASIRAEYAAFKRAEEEAYRKEWLEYQRHLDIVGREQALIKHDEEMERVHAEEEERAKKEVKKAEKEAKKNAPKAEFDTLMRDGEAHMASEFHVYYAAADEFKKASKVKGISVADKKRALKRYQDAVDADERYHKNLNEQRSRELSEELMRSSAARAHAESKARYEAEQAKKREADRAWFQKAHAAAEADKPKQPAQAETKPTFGSVTGQPAQKAQVQEQEQEPARTAEEWYNYAIESYKRNYPAGSFKGYLRASEMGLAKAMSMLGTYLAEGKACRRDEKAAFEWFKRGAELGDIPCLNHMAMCYENGIGTPRDLEKALKIYYKLSGGKETWDTWNVKHNIQQEECMGEVKEYPDLPDYPDKFVTSNATIGLGNFIKLLNGNNKDMLFKTVEVMYADNDLYFNVRLSVEFCGSGFRRKYGNATELRREVDDAYMRDYYDSGAHKVTSSYDYKTVFRKSDYKADMDYVDDIAYDAAVKEFMNSALITVNAARNSYNIIALKDGKHRRIDRIKLKYKP